MRIAKMILCGVCVLGAVSQVALAAQMASTLPTSHDYVAFAGKILLGIIFAIAAFALWKSAFGPIKR